MHREEIILLNKRMQQKNILCTALAKTIENGGLIGGMDERLEVSGVCCSDTLHWCTELTSHQAMAGRYHSPLSLSAPSKAHSHRCIVGSVATGDQQCCSTIWTVTPRDDEGERKVRKTQREKQQINRVFFIFQPNTVCVQLYNSYIYLYNVLFFWTACSSETRWWR